MKKVVSNHMNSEFFAGLEFFADHQKNELRAAHCIANGHVHLIAFRNFGI